eukprot:jgi/Botrbrau1/11166/Bobra.182_2s0021.1
MEPAASSSGITADVGPPREIPHVLFPHIFPWLPLPTILQLSRSSRDCRHAARASIPVKQDQLVASVRSGCSYFTSEQLVVLMQFLEGFSGADPVLTQAHPRELPLDVAPDGSVSPHWSSTRRPRISVSFAATQGDGDGEIKEVKFQIGFRHLCYVL